MRRTLPLPRWSLALVVPAALVAAWLVVFAVDAMAHRGEVARNVEVADLAVGGLGPDDLDERLDQLAGWTDARPVRLVADDGTTFEMSGADLGLRLDVDTTREAALDAGGRGLWRSPVEWLRSLITPTRVEPVGAYDADRARRATEDLVVAEPVEPSLAVTEDDIVVDPGRPGRRLDPAAAADALGQIETGTGPIDVVVDVTEVPTVRDAAALEAVRTEIVGPLGDGVVLVVGDGEVTVPEDGSAPTGPALEVPTGTVLDWVDIAVDDDGATWSIDDERATEQLVQMVGQTLPDAAEFSFAVTEAGQWAERSDGDTARLDITAPGVVEVVSAEGGSVCCAEGSGAAIEAALRAGEPGPIQLPLREALPSEALQAAQELGIVELVGAYTTSHACCQNRVTNIHRIADLVRGYVIPPGGELSINGFVGRRTVDKGFVADGVIANGVFDQAVGGGISQFATTLFNAAFFAGLDFGEYQSHSLYISRYPYGREATLSFPHPDLQVRNPTDHGVLVWTRYTDTTITVELYSTRDVEAVQTGQSQRASDQCTRVTTDRRRTHTDGTVTDDDVVALYRPGEGLDCAGNRTVPVESESEPDPPAPAAPPAPRPTPAPTQPPPPATTQPPAPRPTPAPTRPPPSATPAPTQPPPATPAPTRPPPPPPTTLPAPPSTTPTSAPAPTPAPITPAPPPTSPPTSAAP